VEELRRLAMISAERLEDWEQAVRAERAADLGEQNTRLKTPPALHSWHTTAAASLLITVFYGAHGRQGDAHAHGPVDRRQVTADLIS
jgi:hypothetical protein